MYSGKMIYMEYDFLFLVCFYGVLYYEFHILYLLSFH